MKQGNTCVDTNLTQFDRKFMKQGSCWVNTIFNGFCTVGYL